MSKMSSTSTTQQDFVDIGHWTSGPLVGKVILFLELYILFLVLLFRSRRLFALIKSSNNQGCLAVDCGMMAVL